MFYSLLSLLSGLLLIFISLISSVCAYFLEVLYGFFFPISLEQSIVKTLKSLWGGGSCFTDSRQTLTYTLIAHHIHCYHRCWYGGDSDTETCKTSWFESWGTHLHEQKHAQTPPIVDQWPSEGAVGMPVERPVKSLVSLILFLSTHTHTDGLTQCNLSHIDACLVSNPHARWLLVHAAWFVDSFDVYRGKDLRLDLDFVTVCRVSKAYGPVGETCEWQLIPTRGILHLKIWWYESCFTPAQGCQKI